MQSSNLFIETFSVIPDPRVERAKRHLLVDIIAIAICAVISGADHWIDIEAYAQEKATWLKTFLKLPNGIPSHDTIARLFARLNPDLFQQAFLSWIKIFAHHLPGEVVAIDGKTLRGSHERSKGKKGLHLISAWATEQQLSLGQLKVEDPTSEIAAVPELLKLLLLKGAIVTLDAISCQRRIAAQIKDQEADYVLAVKNNQKSLYKKISYAFTIAEAARYEVISYSRYEAQEQGHGRKETRCYTVLPSVCLKEIEKAWAGVQSIVQVESRRESIHGQVSVEKRYYISSLPVDAQVIGHAIRAHWHIENRLHWSLDVTFKEDASRIRKGYAPENVGWLRRFALSLLKKETSFKGSLRRQRFKALMDNRYLATILHAN